MDTIKVYVRGDSFTPSRFWEYSLVSTNGFVYNEGATLYYNSLSVEDKKKINFKYY